MLLVIVFLMPLRMDAQRGKQEMLPVSVFLFLGLARQVKRETLLVIVFQLKLMCVLQVRERTPLAYVLI